VETACLCHISKACGFGPLPSPNQRRQGLPCTALHYNTAGKYLHLCPCSSFYGRQRWTSIAPPQATASSLALRGRSPRPSPAPRLLLVEARCGVPIAAPAASSSAPAVWPRNPKGSAPGACGCALQLLGAEELSGSELETGRSEGACRDGQACVCVHMRTYLIAFAGVVLCSGQVLSRWRKGQIVCELQGWAMPCCL